MQNKEKVKHIKDTNKYKHEIALKLGFNEEEKVYMVCGGNTYPIKEELKTAGAKFNPVLKWIFADPVELPIPYFIVPFIFDEIYDYIIESRKIFPKKNIKEIISNKIENYAFKKSISAYYPGEVKERIRDIKVKVTSINSFQGMYGYNFIYTFALDKYVFIWFTSKNLEDISINDEVILTGTIKKFEIYEGVYTTYLNRCVIKKLS